jgi:hypothetical protein
MVDALQSVLRQLDARRADAFLQAANSATFFPESTLGCYERRDDM